MGHTTNEPTGYLTFEYAQSFSEFATARSLPRCGGALLERTIPGTSERDAMGAYPLFCCSNLQELQGDLRLLDPRLLSFSAVLDPFFSEEEDALRDIFPDHVLRFKEHFVTDLSRAPESFISPHHRRNASKALRALDVEVSAEPSAYLEQWLTLYSKLAKRHSIGDLRSFSRCAFERQLKVPGITAFIARHKGTVVGMLLWYTHNEVAYYHLGAFNEEGYELCASFALFREAIEYFRGNDIRWLCLGAGAGTTVESDDGLTRFKSGWATSTRPVYFCGRILNRDAYSDLVQSRGLTETDYFPAYRQGEFCKKTSK